MQVKKESKMAGTKAGGLKAARTNIKTYGRDFYAEIGRKGGRNGHTGGFAANPELARIAGFMHDIGNSINRHDHAQSGALLAYQILKDMDMPMENRLTIVTAIGNHDEKTGTAVDAVSAALILGDKTDVRRNRAQVASQAQFDIHDRVNYAVLSSSVVYQADKQAIVMTL